VACVCLYLASALCLSAPMLLGVSLVPLCNTIYVHRDNEGPVVCRTPLRVLRLNGNSKALFDSRISCTQLMSLCEALAEDTTVEYLDLSYNDATPAQRSPDQGTASFGDEGAAIVAQLLKMNKTIKYLILEGNAIGSQGALALAQVLASERGGGAGIQVLNLASNPITDKVKMLSCMYELLPAIWSAACPGTRG
jgi:hypothetical protein